MRVIDLIEAQTGAADASSGWRSGEFLTWPRLLIRVMSVALVIVAIALPVFLPTPYPQAISHSSYWGDLPGNMYTKVQSIDAAVVLTRTSDGAARIDVTEQLMVDFDPAGVSVPQFVQQWPHTIANDLAQLATASGRISRDTTTADDLSDWAPSMVPFDGTNSVGAVQSQELTLIRASRRGKPTDA